MSLSVADLYKYSPIIQNIASGGVTATVTVGANIPANSVVRIDSNGKLVQAFATTGNFANLAGFTLAGASSGFACTFYPSGASAPYTGLTAGATYFLAADGSLTTSSTPAGSPASIKVGYAPNASTFAVNLSTFLL